MDRGRMIDHVQNVNTRQFDKFASGKTSIRLFHPPGGEDHIQLGWSYNEPEELDIKTKKNPVKPVYEPAFVMPKKEYSKSYHVNKYLNEDEVSDEQKVKKYKLQKRKSLSGEQIKITENTKNKNTKKALNEIKEVKEIEEEQIKNTAKKPNKDEDDLTKGGRIMVFNFCK